MMGDEIDLSDEELEILEEAWRDIQEHGLPDDSDLVEAIEEFLGENKEPGEAPRSTRKRKRTSREGAGKAPLRRRRSLSGDGPGRTEHPRGGA